jgi:hypothetical protein
MQIKMPSTEQYLATELNLWRECQGLHFKYEDGTNCATVPPCNGTGKVPAAEPLAVMEAMLKRGYSVDSMADEDTARNRLVRIQESGARKAFYAQELTLGTAILEAAKAALEARA